MENAAQALLIAGGILLAIIILSMLVIMFNNISTMGTAQAEKQEVERLAAWNAEWEAYNKKLLYGAEVLTVINKAEQNNMNYDYKPEYMVNVTVIGIDETEVKNNKTSFFKCTKMERSAETGRIKDIEFEFVE